jgi:hypothetical protein
MNDPRFWPYVACYVGILVYAVYARYIYKLSELIEEGDRSAAVPGFIVWMVLWIPSIFLASWVDQTLWNMVAPVFGWPLIDLFSALIIGTLVSSLIWTTAGIRRVRIEK